VKILDFGLAKLVRPDALPDQRDEDPTRSMDTKAGAQLGTVGYMSPEQVEGLPIDQRSDIFALGTVLYEMISGRRAFQRRTSVETQNAILNEDPPLLAAGSGTVPTAVERIVARCLEKKPGERFQSARDLAFALEALSGHSDAATIGTMPASVSRRWRRPLVPLAMLVAGLGIGMLVGRETTPQRVPTFRQLTHRHGVVTSARFAPDGRTIVYSAAWDGEPQEIFTTRIENPEARSLGLPPAILLAVSSQGELAILITPDLEYLGAHGTLARVSLSGGALREVLADVEDASWSPDGSSLCVTRAFGGQDQLEFPIGHVLYRSPDGISWPRVSPKGDRRRVQG
jgi:serine/threonine protein kinase